MDKLFRDINNTSNKKTDISVHLANFPEFNEKLIDKELEERMNIAQKVTSMVLALRRKVNIKVRQPLQKIMIPVLNNKFRERLEAVKTLISNEVNVKEIEYITDTTGILVKKIKPDFKKLGPKYGKMMKQISQSINNLSQEQILQLESNGSLSITIDGNQINISTEEVEIISEDIPGWLVTNDGQLTVALDITITDELRYEGLARELINRVQNIRKEKGFDVTDKIKIEIEKQQDINTAVNNFKKYISTQTLANSIEIVETLKENNRTFVQLNDVDTNIRIEKI